MSNTRIRFPIRDPVNDTMVDVPIIIEKEGPSEWNNGDTISSIGVEYTLVQLLGKGGMGEVWKARALYKAGPGVEDDVETDVALKFIRGLDPILNELMIKEAKITARLKHENIVHFNGWGFIPDKKKYLISMDYIEGMDVNGLMQRHNLIDEKKPRHVHLLGNNIRRIPDKMVAFIMFQVAAGLDYAHNFKYNGSRGVYHRDMSPGNILIKSDEGRVVISDFGIAVTTEDLKQTNSGIPAGKLPYISPEGLYDCRSVDGRSDMYSLGAVAYEMMTGLSPNQSFEPVPNLQKSIEKTLEMTLVRDLIPPNEIVQNVDKDLSYIVCKLLSKAPHERYKSAEELFKALGEYMYSGGFGPTKLTMRDYIATNDSLQTMLDVTAGLDGTEGCAEIKWVDNITLPIPYLLTERSRQKLEKGLNPARRWVE